jgi:hypothetical protein
MNTGYCKDCQDYNSCESEYKEPSGSCDLWQPVLTNREELKVSEVDYNRWEEEFREELKHYPEELKCNIYLNKLKLLKLQG